MAQTVKRLPTMRETRVRFLGREDPLEKEMAIHSSTLAWKIPWMEEPDRLQSMGSQRVRHNWVTSLSLVCQAKEDRADSCFVSQPRGIWWVFTVVQDVVADWIRVCAGPQVVLLSFCSLLNLTAGGFLTTPFLISNCFICPLELRECPGG